jgi:hypothetical protein
MPRKPKYDYSHIPECPGVYMLYVGDECVYIGRSRNMRQRLRCHPLRYSYDRVVTIPLPLISLQGMEQTLIYRHKPKYNKVFRDNMAYEIWNAWYWAGDSWIVARPSAIEGLRARKRCIAVRKAS